MSYVNGLITCAPVGYSSQPANVSLMKVYDFRVPNTQCIT